MNTINTFMINTNRFSDKKTRENTQSESLKTLLHLGETMIADKKFDIKQYLDTAENKVKFKNIKKQNLKNMTNFSTDYLNFKNEKSKNLSTYTNNNFYNNKIFNDYKNNSLRKSKYDNKMPKLNLNSLSIGKSKIFEPNIINSTKKNSKTNYLDTLTSYNYNNKSKINERYNNMFDKNKTVHNDKKNKNNVYKYEDDNDHEDNRLFKIEKVVKQIKKNKNKSYDFYKYIDKVKNMYDKKNALIAIDSDILLNNYKHKQRKIKDVNTPISTFITQNKEISIKNLLIKIINKESDKLVKKEQKLTKDLKTDKSNLENDEKKFEEYSDLQKSECKKIQMTLKELEKKNRDLMSEEKKYKLEVKIKEYEIYKILVQMNLYRFYAKFANQVLDGDATRFEKPILSDMLEFDKIDFEPIINEVINNYSSMKKFDNKKSKDDNKLLKFYKEEGYFLYDPELIYHKFNEMEGNILRLLAAKEKLIVKIKKRQKQNNEALSYLIDRCKILQQEYDDKNNNYTEENRKFLNDLKNSGSTHINVNIHEKNNLIQDLYMSVINEFEPTIIQLSKMNKKEFNLVDKKDLVHFEEIVEYGKNILENIEINLNCLLIQMKNDENSDKKIFDKVIYGIKTDYKLLRQSLFFKNRREKQKNQRNKIMDRAKKIVLISKKIEPPYYISKNNKKEEIDYNLIKKEEDKELMTYH